MCGYLSLQRYFLELMQSDTLQFTVYNEISLSLRIEQVLE